MNKEEIQKILKYDSVNLGEITELNWMLNKHLYKEKPVSIQEFIDSDDFVHNKWNNVFPIWRKTLSEIYPTPFNAPFNEIIISAAAGAGKELSNDSGVLTPKGWIEIGNIKVGDYVCGTDGKVHIVEGVYPQGKKPIYNICFSDGTVVKAGAEHLWTVQNYKDREKRNSSNGTRTRTISTIEMLDNIKVSRGKRLNYSIDYIQPCYFIPNQVDLDPYLLGVLIGDGSFFKNLSFSNSEDDLIEKIIKKLKLYDCDISFTKDSRSEVLKNFNIINSVKLKNLLIKYNLYRKYAWEKHIPKEYIYNSIEVRLSVLQGLIDTDGYVESNSKDNHNRSGMSIEYSTTSKQLAEDIIEIVRSLGGRATCTERMGKYRYKGIKKETRMNYRINISFCNGIIPYTSEKHLSKYHPEYLRPLKKYITAIELNGESECTCIKVSSPNHLFITDGYNATHNTVTATIGTLYDMYKIGCLKDPCQFYKLSPGTMLIFAVFSATGSTAAVNWQDITTGIEMCPWINEKVVDRRGLEKKNGSLVPVEILPGIFIQTGSKFQHSMGKAIFDGLMDEAAFGGDNIKEAQKTYNELSSRMATRFRSYAKSGNLPGHLFLISSPKESTDFMQHRIDVATKANSKYTMIKKNISSWEANPANDSDDKFTVFVGNDTKEPKIIEDNDRVSINDMDYLIYPPMSYYEEFKKDLLGSIMNYGGVTTVSDVSLFKSPTMLNSCMVLNNPFNSNIIKLPFSKHEKQLMDFMDISYFKDIRHPEYNRFIHLDVAFSSDTIDRYGLASGYCTVMDSDVYKNINDNDSDVYTKSERMYYIDFAIGIEPCKGQEVPLYKVEDFIKYLIKNLNYPVASISADTFQSKQTLQNFEGYGYDTESISVDRSRDPYLFLRQLVYNQQILLPKHDELKKELQQLKDDGKKINHPPITGTKDISDAVAGCIWNCANSNKLLNVGKVTQKIYSPTITFNPLLQNNNLELMEFESMKSKLNGMFKGM